MMPDERDPRRDPQPGDVVDVECEIREIVAIRLDGGVRWKSWWSGASCKLATWRRWAKRGEVVRRCES